MNETTALALTIAIPLLSSPVIYLVGRLVSRTGGLKGRANPAAWLAVAALLAAFIPLGKVGTAVLSGETAAFQFQGITMAMDGLGLLLATVVLVLGLMVAIFSMVYMAAEPNEEKYYALLVAMAGSIVGLGSATDLFNLWAWFEAMAITSYTLVAFYRSQKDALEAGVKYLVQSASGSVLVLLGIAMVFAQTGTLELSTIRAVISQPTPLLWLACALFLVGFGVKAALVPMHTWLPDAHSQAPSGISAMLSGVVIEAGLVALLRVAGSLIATSHSWGTLLLGFGALNMIVGNLMALQQKQVKRLLAYSSVAHMGYIVFGLGIAVQFAAVGAAAGAFFHILTHALMKGLAFLSAGVFLYVLHLEKHDHNPLVVEDLNGASRRYPLPAFTFSLAVLALGGLPPLAGFMSKWQILAAGVGTGDTAILVLVIFAAFNSVLSLGYYAPMVNRIYRSEPSALVNQGAPSRWSFSLPLVVMSLAILVLGVWPSLSGFLTNPAASAWLASVVR